MPKIVILEDALVVLHAAEQSFQEGREYEFALPLDFNDLGFDGKWMQAFFENLLSSKAELIHVRLAVQQNRSAGHWFFLPGRVPLQRVFKTANGTLKNRLGPRIGQGVGWPSSAMPPEIAAQETLERLIGR